MAVIPPVEIYPPVEVISLVEVTRQFVVVPPICLSPNSCHPEQSEGSRSSFPAETGLLASPGMTNRNSASAIRIRRWLQPSHNWLAHSRLQPPLFPNCESHALSANGDAASCVSTGKRKRLSSSVSMTQLFLPADHQEINRMTSKINSRRVPH